MTHGKAPKRKAWNKQGGRISRKIMRNTVKRPESEWKGK